MNKKFLSAVLFGALMVTSTGTFVSCKDYDDDIDNLQNQIDQIETTLADLKTQVGNAGVSSVTFDEATGVLTVVTGGTPKTYTIKTPATEVEKVDIVIDGKDLKVDGKVIGQVGDSVEVKDDVLYVNGDATSIKLGQYAILTDNSNGVVTISLPDANGVMQTITLPTSSAAITSISILTTTPQFDYRYGVAASDVTWDGPKEGIKKGLLKGLNTAASDLKLQVFPSSADLTNVSIKLVDSEGKEAPVVVTATPYESGDAETITRAASANGMWKLAVEATDDVTADNITSKFPTIVSGTPAARTAYALQIGGNILTTYNVTVGSAKANSTPVTDVYYKGKKVDANNKIPAGETVTLTFDKETVYDAYLVANTTTQASGVTVSGKTMTISSTSASVGKNATLTLKYAKLADGTTGTKDVTIYFEGTTVDPEAPATEVTYKAIETAGAIIMDLGTTLTSMSAADAARINATSWAVADPDKKGLAENFIYSVKASDVTYFATEADAKAGEKEITLSANTVQTIKYAKLAAGTYQDKAKAGSYTLNMTLTDANSNEIKKVAVPVKVTLPTFNELFSKSAAFSENVLTAVVYGNTEATAKKYSLADAFARVTNSGADWTHLTLKAEDKNSTTKWVAYNDATAAGSAGNFEITNLIEDGKIAKESVAITGTYAIAGKDGLKIDVPAFSVKFKSPFAGATLVYYVQDVKKGKVPVTLDASGNNTIGKYDKKDGLKLESAVDNSNVAFAQSGAIFGVTLDGNGQDDNDNVSATVENKADATTVTLVTEGLKLASMPAGSYDTTITVTITDGNGIKTDIALPISVNK